MTELPGAHPMIQEILAILTADGADAKGKLQLSPAKKPQVDAILKKYSEESDAFAEAAWQLMTFAAFLDMSRGEGALATALMEALERCAKQREATGVETAAIEKAKRIKESFQNFQGQSVHLVAPHIEKRSTGVVAPTSVVPRTRPQMDAARAAAGKGPQENLVLEPAKGPSRRRAFTVE